MWRFLLGCVTVVSAVSVTEVIHGIPVTITYTPTRVYSYVRYPNIVGIQGYTERGDRCIPFHSRLNPFRPIDLLCLRGVRPLGAYPDPVRPRHEHLLQAPGQGVYPDAPDPPHTVHWVFGGPLHEEPMD